MSSEAKTSTVIKKSTFSDKFYNKRMLLVKHWRKQSGVNSLSVCRGVEEALLRPGCVLYYRDVLSVAWRKCPNRLL